ncbi:flagellin [Thalassobaculum litoreum]|uniref:Flagellin FlgL n=1 Tax=Thalassobaculum litoreum DSM 18839 TaxID=1123362 RepID=A0A8G2BKQ2_9PROT|nr:flagellin [Thalassobaculum litoreum]SDG27375.1 Flagellin FlgL [Thalassobaculum litoreum DSM 18839]
MRISTLSQNLRIDTSITSIQRRIADAQQQISTGKRSQVYSGFSGQDTRLLITLKEQRTSADSYINSINNTKVKTETIDATLQQMTSVAEDLRTQLYEQVEGLFEQSSLALSTFATAAINQMSNLLNQTTDGKYLFNGTDTDTQPIIDPATTQGAYAQPALAGGSAGIIAAAEAFFDVDANWNNVTTPAPGSLSVRVDQGVDLDFGELANDSATFEEVFDVLYAFSNTTFTAGDDAEYRNLLNWGLGKIEAAIDLMNDMVGQNGVVGSEMATRQEAHKETILLLETQIGKIEDVDPYEAVAEFQTLQAQLEASFQTTAVLRNLSLTKFI